MFTMAISIIMIVYDFFVAISSDHPEVVIGLSVFGALLFIAIVAAILLFILIHFAACNKLITFMKPTTALF